MEYRSKYKGQNVRFLLAAALTSGAMIATPQIARAAVTVQEPSGPNSSGQTYNQAGGEDGISVKPQSTFTVDTDLDDAVSITGTGTITYDAEYANNTLETRGGNGLFVQNNGDTGSTVGSIDIISNASITGTNYGIYSRNKGTGGIDITTDANVTGTGIVGSGVYADLSNLNSIEDITINTKNGDIQGGTFGIWASNSGTGGISITADGDVTGTTSVGIYGYVGNLSGTEGITITTGEGTVTGGHYGIEALNYGSGDTTITTNGKVTGNDYSGIYSLNSGTGGIHVITNGDVTGGTDDSAINGQISNSSSTKDVVIDAESGNITGGTYGIESSSTGTGGIKITTNGNVTGTSNTGIYSDITNSNSTGDITITSNTGDIYGGTYGVNARNSGTGGVTITTDGNVTGASNYGIYGSITNFSSTKDVVIDAKSGNITGGAYGIYSSNTGTGGINITTNGDVRGTNSTGINSSMTTSSSTGDITITSNTGDIYGGAYGVNARNGGTGGVSITTNGNVTGASNYGIYGSITNSSSTKDLTITVLSGTVKGGKYGIHVSNSGMGGITINSAAGTVESTFEDGISAEADGAGLINIITADVTGGAYGIYARNYGTGGVTIDSGSGAVVGEDGRGVYARTSNSSTGDIFVTTGDVTGTDDYGIYARQDGSGKLTVISNGKVTSDSDEGIHAEGHGGDINVTTQEVEAAEDGINVEQSGAGALTVITSGKVTSTGDDGIDAQISNRSSTKDINITTDDVEAAGDGITAENNGSGSIIINSTAGTVIGGTTSDGDGIYAYAAQGLIDITTADVTGGDDGINIDHDDTAGDVVVTVMGNITGKNDDGINIAQNGNGNVTVTTSGVVAASGTDANHNEGITIENDGTGTTTVNANGEVHGRSDAIYIGANSLQINLTIGANGNVHNTSNDSADIAVWIEGGSGSVATITNNGIITGSVQLGDENDTLTNTGTIEAAVAGSISTTTYSGLEKIIDSGDINMQNGIAGDNIIFTNNGTGIYQTAGSHSVLVDADIITIVADELHVDNAVTGSAPNGINVNIVNGLGNPITGGGVKIVDVINNSDLDAFQLDAPLNGGLYAYLLGQNNGDPDWYLQSNARPETVATNMLSVLGSRTALSTLSNVHDRQRDAKVLLDDNNSHKGVWGRIFGNSEEFNADDANDFGYRAHTWGAQAGIDFFAKGDAAGNRKYAGLYVAYADASGDARQHDSNVASLEMNATTVGAYYTKYSPKNWYVDLTGQYSWLSGIHAKTADNDLSPNGSSYALSAEVGQQFRPESSIIREVQAQLIYQNTDIDDVALSDQTQIHLSPVNAVTGRFGLRLYGNPKSGKSFLPWARANLWHTFSKDAAVSSLGNSIATPIGGTSGELELGFTNGSQSSGWSFYGSAGYLFNLGGAEYSGWKGTLGLRKGW